MEQEKMLKESEFNSLLAKYRSIVSKKAMPKVKLPQQEDIYPENMENIKLPMKDIMKVIKSGKSVYSDEVKSIKNVLKVGS